VIVERFYSRLTLDFDTNKRVTDEAAVVPSKRMRNKIAGFVTHLMRRIERNQQVRGISLKLQEEEKERRLDFVPEVSALQTDILHVDKDTKHMLELLRVGGLNLHVQDPSRQEFQRGPRRDGAPWYLGRGRAAVGVGGPGW
jgi:small subunit ribosomal protein S17e